MTTLTRVAFAVLVGAVCTGAQTTSMRGKTPVPVFVVIKEAYSPGIILDPLFLLAGNTIRPFPDPCDLSPRKQAVFKRYVRPGARYTLVFGGAAVGSVVVGPLEENLFPESTVKLETRISVQRLDMALAVHPSIVLPKACLRRNPTASERRRAERLTRSNFRARGVRTSEFLRMRIEQLTVMPMSSDDPEIVVAASIEDTERTGIQWSLLFVASEKSDDADALWFQHAKKETDAQSLYIVDRIDVDGDGVNEVVARRVFYEDYLYEAYKQQNGHWNKIFTPGPYNCVAWIHPQTE